MENKQFIQIGTEYFKILKAGALTSEYESQGKWYGHDL